MPFLTSPPIFFVPWQSESISDWRHVDYPALSFRLHLLEAQAERTMGSGFQVVKFLLASLFAKTSSFQQVPGPPEYDPTSGAQLN
jgi:hypothetical protein